MYKKIIQLFVLLVSFLCANFSQAKELVWSDEFDYQGLPDSRKWGGEEGYVRNKEVQYYRGRNIENTYVDGEYLVIRALKHDGGIEGSETNPKYTSGSLSTKNMHNWKFGRIEVRAKFPLGNGVWPAIWTLGTNITEVGWPKSGEIDIVEYVGRFPDKAHVSIHFFDYENAHRKRKMVTQTYLNDPGDFHVYSIEWTETALDFFIDDRRVRRIRMDKVGEQSKHAFLQPHYLIINLALGGEWAGAPEDSIFPAQFVIDYVRIYQ
jgi:beta-glucanase (GH16 family)